MSLSTVTLARKRRIARGLGARLTSEVFFAVYAVSHIAKAYLSVKERKAASYYTEDCNRPVLDPYEGPKICQQYSEDVGYGDGSLAGRNQRTCTIGVSRPHNLAALRAL